MRVHLHPQRRTVELAGRRSVGRLLTELAVGQELVEDDDEIEIRAVISGGAA